MNGKKIKYCLKAVEIEKHLVLSLEKTLDGITLVIKDSDNNIDGNSILSITPNGYLLLHGAIGDWTGLKLNTNGKIRCRPRVR
jgi:hypothetical protein